MGQEAAASEPGERVRMHAPQTGHYRTAIQPK